MLDVGFWIPSTHEGLSALDVLRRQTVLSSETHLVLQFQRPHKRWSLGRWVADVGSQTPVQLHTQTSQLQKRFGKHWGFDPGSQLSLKRVAVCVRESPSVDMWVRFLKLQKKQACIYTYEVINKGLLLLSWDIRTAQNCMSTIFDGLLTCCC